MLGHRVLVGLHRANYLHRLIQQNHDSLPQKAGLPQEALNEIHGAIHAPDNPVVPIGRHVRHVWSIDCVWSMRIVQDLT